MKRSRRRPHDDRERTTARAPLLLSVHTELDRQRRPKWTSWEREEITRHDSGIGRMNTRQKTAILPPAWALVIGG